MERSLLAALFSTQLQDGLQHLLSELVSVKRRHHQNKINLDGHQSLHLISLLKLQLLSIRHGAVLLYLDKPEQKALIISFHAHSSCAEEIKPTQPQTSQILHYCLLATVPLRFISDSLLSCSKKRAEAVH